MCFIVQLHYLFRAALHLLEHLRLVKVEWVRVCSQQAELRVTLFTASRDVNNNKRKTCGSIVVIHNNTSPVKLGVPMKKSTVARCTMVHESLKRRDYPGGKKALRSRRSLSDLHVSFQENAGVLIGHDHGTRTRDGTDTTPPSKRFSRKSGVAIYSTGNAPLEAKTAGAADQHDSAFASVRPTYAYADCDDTGLPRGRTSHQRRPSMWRMGLLYLDRGDSGILAALKNANAGGHDTRTPGSPPAHFAATSEAEQRILDGRSRRRSLSQSSVQWVPPPDTPGIKFNLPRARPEDNTFTPDSDRTLFEEPELLSLDRPAPGSPDYFTFENGDGDQATRTEVMPAPLQRRVRHSRAPSTEPNFRSNPKRASLPLRARTKTNEGLLLLQSNPSKAVECPTSQHERRISLGIPLKPAIAQNDNVPRTKFGALLDTPPQTPKTPRTPRARAPEKSGPAATLRQKERDLEYKHRHTFIGTASLDDFLEVLDVSEEHTTTKAAVGKAFLILASSERLLARQASSTSTGWDLVSRTIPDVVNTDYVIQAHVKLGSITLWQFLDLIPFNEEEEAGAMSVVEAYSAASHMDSKAGVGAMSKAKVFRSWMVEHEAKQR